MVKKIGIHTIEFYEELDKMPAYRHQVYTLNLMMDADIGSDAQSASNHILNIKSNIDKNPGAAKKTCDLLHQCLLNVITKTSYKNRSFVAAIKKINGEFITDDQLSDNGISKIIKDLSKKGLTQRLLDSFFEEVKKKLKKTQNYFSRG